MALTVFTVYFLTLAVLVWADLIQTSAGVLVVLIVLGVGITAIAAAGRLTRR
jgi:hypothetical protein